MNGQWLRRLDIDDLYQRAAPFWGKAAATADESYKKQVLALVQDRLKTLSELPAMTEYFFTDPAVDESLLTTNKQLKKLSSDQKVSLLEAALAKLTIVAPENWTEDHLQEALNQLLTETEQKPGVLFSLIRIVTTWAPFSPQLNQTLALLGKERVLQLIRQGIDVIASQD